MDELEAGSYLAAYLEAQRQHTEFLRWVETRNLAAAQQLTVLGHAEGWLPTDLHFAYE